MSEGQETVATALTGFKKEVGQLFEQVDKRFEQVDKRFEQVDKRFEQVDKRFEALERQIAAEGEKTRTHFDVALEQMKAERNLVLDQSLANRAQLAAFRGAQAEEHAVLNTRLDNHEQRLRKLENL